MTEPNELLPDDFLKRLPSIVPAGFLNRVMTSFGHRRPCTFRANTLKITADELEEKLTALGFMLEKISWYSNAFILRNKTQKELTSTDLYERGFFYVQSLSSMIPPLVLDSQPGETIGDITAAPGSKTTEIAMMMGNTGKIIANDKSRVRNYKLEANIKTQGVTNTQVTAFAGQILWQTYPEHFDRTLVDVPCSMEGRFFTEDPKSYSDWSTKKIKELAQTQKFLLRSAISCTKPGGTIVYSTCTLAPEENEGVIDWILKKEGDAIDVAPIFLEVKERQEAIVNFGDKTFDPRVARSLRIVPSDLMEGFFVAKLVKMKSTIPSVLRVQ